MLTSCVCREHLSFKLRLRRADLSWSDLSSSERARSNSTLCVCLSDEGFFLSVNQRRGLRRLDWRRLQQRPQAQLPGLLKCTPAAACRANLVTTYAASTTNVKMYVYVSDMQHLACKALIWWLHYAWLALHVLSLTPIPNNFWTVHCMLLSCNF